MSVLIAGILFPESIMRTTWFFYLTAFVAFNTIIFVGLSIAKLMLWPRPAVPDDVVPTADRRTFEHRHRYGRLTEREDEHLTELTDDDPNT